MKYELDQFIKAIAAGDEHVYTERGHTTLIEKTKALLGFRRHHTVISRPDSDPRWSPFIWSSNLNSSVDNIRVMSFKMLYAHSLKEITEITGAKFPNEWKVSEYVDALIQLRLEYKKAYIEGSEITRMYHNVCVSIAKFMLNSSHYIIGNCGSGLSVPLGAHEVVAHARTKITEAVKKISETGVVLYVNVDEIIYIGDQVEFENVHHEKYKTVILFSPNRVAYGNEIVTSMMPRTRFDMSGWRPAPFGGLGTVEDQRKRAEARIAKKTGLQRKSLDEYINKTKEQIDAENSVDLSDMIL